MNRNKFKVKNEGILINKTLGDSSVTIPVEANVFWVKFVKKSVPVAFKTGESWLYDFTAMLRYPCASAWQFEDYEKKLNGYFSTTTIKSVEKINKDKIILHNPTEADIRLILKRPDSSPPKPGSGYSAASVSPKGANGKYGVSGGGGGDGIESNSILLIPTYVGKFTVSVEAVVTANFDSQYAPFNAHQNAYVASGPTTEPGGNSCVFNKIIYSQTGYGLEFFKSAERAAHLITFTPDISGGVRFMGVDTPYTPVEGGGGYFTLNAIHNSQTAGGIWVGKGRKSGHSQYFEGKWTVFPDDPPVAQGSISAVIKFISVSPDLGFLPFDIYYLSDPNGSGDPSGSSGGSGGGNQPGSSQAGEKLPKKKSDIVDAPNSKYMAEVYFNNTKIYETTASELLCTFPINLIGSLPNNNPETTDDDAVPDDWTHPLDEILDNMDWSEKIGSNWGLFPGKISEILITNREKFDFDKTKGVDEMLEPLVPNSLNLYSNTKVYSITRERHVFLLLEGAAQQTKLQTVGSDFYIDRNCDNNYCCFQFKRLTVIEVNNNSSSVKYYPIRDGVITGLPEWIKELDYDGFLNPYFFFPTSNNLCRVGDDYNGGAYGLNTQGIHQLTTKGINPYFISREIPIPNKDNNFNSSFSTQRFSKFYVGANSYKINNIKFIYGFPFGVYYNYSDFYTNNEAGIYGLGTGIVTDDMIRYYNNINHSKNNLYIAAKVGAGEENISIDNFNLNSSFPIQDTVRVGEMIGSKGFRDSLKDGDARVQFKIAKTETINNDAIQTIRSYSSMPNSFIETITIYGFYPGYTGNLTNPAWITSTIFQGISDNYTKSFDYPWNKYYGYSGFSYLKDDNINANISKRQKFPYISDDEKVFNFLPETKFQLSSIVKLPQINNIDDKSLVYFVTAIRTDGEEEKERNEYIDPFSMTLEQRLTLRD